MVLRSGDAMPDALRGTTNREKRTLRQRIVRDRLRNVTSGTVRGQTAARTAALLAYPPVRTASTVAVYVTQSAEPDTAALRSALRAAGVRVLLPRLLPDDDLEFAADTGADLLPGRRGTRGPDGPHVPLAAADVILVPAVAVDVTGHRLGRGGGSYDRALTRARPDAVTIALINPGELLYRVPADPHDIPVDAVALPGGVVRLRR